MTDENEQNGKQPEANGNGTRHKERHASKAFGDLLRKTLQEKHVQPIQLGQEIKRRFGGHDRIVYVMQDGGHFPSGLVLELMIKKMGIDLRGAEANALRVARFPTLARVDIDTLSEAEKKNHAKDMLADMREIAGWKTQGMAKFFSVSTANYFGMESADGSTGKHVAIRTDRADLLLKEIKLPPIYDAIYPHFRNDFREAVRVQQALKIPPGIGLPNRTPVQRDEDQTVSKLKQALEKGEPKVLDTRPPVETSIKTKTREAETPAVVPPARKPLMVLPATAIPSRNGAPPVGWPIYEDRPNMKGFDHSYIETLRPSECWRTMLKSFREAKELALGRSLSAKELADAKIDPRLALEWERGSKRPWGLDKSTVDPAIRKQQDMMYGMKQLYGIDVQAAQTLDAVRHWAETDAATPNKEKAWNKISWFEKPAIADPAFQRSMEAYATKGVDALNGSSAIIDASSPGAEQPGGLTPNKTPAPKTASSPEKPASVEGARTPRVRPGAKPIMPRH